MSNQMKEMKKVVVVMALALLGFLMACKPSSAKTLTVGESYKVTTKKITKVKSSNKKVATVSKKGIVRAKKSGKTTVRCWVKVKGKKKIIKVKMIVKKEEEKTEKEEKTESKKEPESPVPVTSISSARKIIVPTDAPMYEVYIGGELIAVTPAGSILMIDTKEEPVYMPVEEEE